ncbi:putative replication factor A protein 3 [Hamiltosporidium tvaerminnensis]|uniref:Putative replication factor A protein 3 n=2 Tax=Hamiltosporidium TaxID=1176354 RepID=A0A4Q9KZ28_9MICR|nr:putative replication factor A protein 3 [Hamiltosporidium tvaerminnensis]
MFINKDSLKNHINETVQVIGKVSRIEPPLIFLNTPEGDIKVTFVNLHKYTKSYICVTGKVQQDLTIQEIHVDHMGDNFDVEVYESNLTPFKQQCLCSNLTPFKQLEFSIILNPFKIIVFNQ